MTISTFTLYIQSSLGMSLFRTYLILCKQGLYSWLIQVSILISRTNNFIEHHELIISLSIWSLTNELRYPSSHVINSRMRRQAQERWLSSEIKQKTKLQGGHRGILGNLPACLPNGVAAASFPLPLLSEKLGLISTILMWIKRRRPKDMGCCSK